MAEIKVGQQWRNLIGYHYPTHLQEGDVTTVTKIEFEGHRIWFNPSPYDEGDFGGYTDKESFLNRFELVEELAPLKLEHLKVGQLVIHKSDGWQRFITEVVEDRIWHLSGFEAGYTIAKSAINASDFLKNFRLPDISEVGQFKKDNPDLFAEYVMLEESVADAISPSVYQFPNGVEVRDISAHLTSFGGQAVQYIARATRLDGVVKGLPVQDLKKAIQLLEWEVERLES